MEQSTGKSREARGGTHPQLCICEQGELGDRDFSTKIVSELASLCKEDAPMIVLFYSPPFYPAVSSKDDPLIRKVMREVKQYAADRHGIEFTEVQYFPGLSDLSYLRTAKTVSRCVHIQYAAFSSRLFTSKRTRKRTVCAGHQYRAGRQRSSQMDGTSPCAVFIWKAARYPPARDTQASLRYGTA